MKKVISTLVILLLSLCYQGDCCHEQSCSCLEGLPTRGEVEGVALENPSQLETHFQELWIFPALNFSCSGSIVRWTVAASNVSNGRGRPEISIWRQSADNPSEYTKMGGRLMDANICTTHNLSSTSIAVHDNLLPEPLEFHVGDVLGLLLRRERVASLVPYLHSGGEGSLAYFFNRAGSPDGQVLTIAEDFADTLLPLLAIDICQWESSDDCRSVSFESAQLCRFDLPSPSPTLTPSPDDSDSSGNNLSRTMLIVITAVPSAVVILFLLLALVAVIVGCGLYHKRIAARRYSSSNTGKPSLNSSVLTDDTFEIDPTYETIRPWVRGDPPPPYSMELDPSPYMVVRAKQ